jgi:hypothetical protein
MHMTNVSVIGLTLVSLMTFLDDARAATQCGPHDRLVAALGHKFQEARQGIGLANEQVLVELFVSPKGTWTMTSTNVNGITCILASGEAWESDPVKVAELDS